jgi:hypothetical protein
VGIGDGAGLPLGYELGDGVGLGVGEGAGLGVGVADGSGVDEVVGVGAGDGLGAGPFVAVGAGASSSSIVGDDPEPVGASCTLLLESVAWFCSVSPAAVTLEAAKVRTSWGALAL